MNHSSKVLFFLTELFKNIQMKMKWINMIKPRPISAFSVSLLRWSTCLKAFPTSINEWAPLVGSVINNGCLWKLFAAIWPLMQCCSVRSYICQYLPTDSISLSLDMTRECRGGNSYGIWGIITGILVIIYTNSSFWVGAYQTTGYGCQGVWTGCRGITWPSDMNMLKIY